MTGTPGMVIFDCDGVLVDSEPVANRVMAEFLSKSGYPVAPEDCEARFVGRPLSDIIDEVQATGIQLGPDWREAFYNQLDAALRAGVPLVAGIIEVLDAVDAAGLASAIVSNGRMHKMRLTLGPHGLWHRFAGRIYSPQIHGAPKPSPDLFHRAAAQAGIAPDRCVVVDDSPSGVKGALNAGMRCIGYAERTPTKKLAAFGIETATTMADLRRALGLP